MLRDVLCGLPGLGTWPCDEINTIWRYGNPGWPTDELPPELATERVIRYIESYFARLARTQRLKLVVEKTCANSLRVPYVNTVLPDARYVWIHRDPIDCVVSGMKRWRAETDWGYTLRKARYVPLRDLPVYGLRFARNRLYRLTSEQGRVAAWGPIFEGMHDELASRSLMDVCALQWKACIGQAAVALAELPPATWVSISYEQFVLNPVGQMAALCNFLGLSVDLPTLELVTAGVSDSSVGKGARELGVDAVERIRSLVDGAVAARKSSTDLR